LLLIPGLLWNGCPY